MKTSLLIVALFALLGLASSQVCTPVATCSATLSAVQIPSPFYSLTFSTDPRPTTGAVYNYSATSGVNETGCASAAYHTGVVAFLGSTLDTVNIGSSINITAPFGQGNTISTPLPTTVILGVGTSQGNVAAGTAGWSIEFTFKALAQTQWAKLFDFGQDGVGVPGGAGGRNEILMGWRNTDNQLVWSTSNGPDINTIANVVFGQWYHTVLVYQETATGLANYNAYVNGALVGTASNAYFPIAIARASAELARSNWADRFWIGELDTFNIYKYALTPAQAAALSNRAQGGCAINVAAPANATVPAPVFDASFTTDPRSSAGGAAVATYGWVSQDADDAACGLNAQHTGLLQLNGQYAGSGNPAGQYVNISAVTGPQSIGQVLPTIGGNTTNVVGSAGWSFEITFKVEVAYTYAKIFDLAAPQNASRCQHDILLGFLGSTVNDVNSGKQPVLQFDVCNGNFQETALNNIANLQLGTWYHVVITITQQLPLQPTQAVYTAYVNGVLAAVSGATMNYPEAVPRMNGNIGRSNWANDNYWGGLIDSFRIYNQSLSASQVSTLYTASMGAAGTQRCATVAASALPTTVPTSAVAYSLSFTTNPTPTTGAVYTWLASDPTDTAADRAIHTGLLQLGGFPVGTYDGGIQQLGPYVNLTATSGSTSVGSQPFPMLGTNLNGLWSQNSVGFSIETVVKMRSQNTFAKVFDLGVTRNSLTDRFPCNGDIVIGWNGGDTQLEFETCSDSGANSAKLVMPNTTTLNQWLHIIVVMQQTYDNNALATAYVNGVRMVSQSMAFPFGQTRAESHLGHSNWNDQFINATYDLFQVYNIALNAAQVQNQYRLSQGLPVVAPGVSSSSSSAAVSVSSSAGSSSSGVVAARSSSSSSSSAAAAVSSSAVSSSGGGVIVVGGSSSSSAAAVVASSSSSAAAVAASSSSSSAAAVARSSSSSSAGSSSTAANVASVTSSSSTAASVARSSSSSTAVVASVSSVSSSGAVVVPTTPSSSTGSVVPTTDSSSSTGVVAPTGLPVDVLSSSTGVVVPPVDVINAAASTFASVAVLVVCAVASLALML